MSEHLKLSLPPTTDFHVHLRDDALMRLVTPTIEDGGVDTVYVMPNLQPPITSVAAAISYRKRLQSLAPNVTFLMTLYLDKTITPTTIAEAAAAGIVGLKSYPAGVTTHSEGGMLDYQSYYPIFEAMQKHDLVLNLHGEVPSTPFSGFHTAGQEPATVLNAEPKFLPILHSLHADFPNLRIVLEHCTTKEAIDAVVKCGPTVAGTITAHHLWLTVDDWCGDSFNFCKPVAKTPTDRLALLKAVVDEAGHGKFFFGTDSAPHAIEAKTGMKKAAAGCFTQGWATQLVIGAIEEALKHGWLEAQAFNTETLANFLRHRGRRFYKLAEDNGPQREILLEKRHAKIPDILESSDASLRVVPFRRGEDVWSLAWKS
ncbi:MAG: hypothetical protein M1829_002786 [Trizodia sp. TS-e1964]|nr:MAG: hypothetical protein M1829_002786 [Trizodia sp. TS-e1964]